MCVVLSATAAYNQCHLMLWMQINKWWCLVDNIYIDIFCFLFFELEQFFSDFAMLLCSWFCFVSNSCNIRSVFTPKSARFNDKHFQPCTYLCFFFKFCFCSKQKIIYTLLQQYERFDTRDWIILWREEGQNDNMHNCNWIFYISKIHLITLKFQHCIQITCRFLFYCVVYAAQCSYTLAHRHSTRSTSKLI